MPLNTPLRAITDGTILYNRTNSGGASKGYGHFLVIKYDNNYFSLYAHLIRRSTLKEWNRVKKGQVVAYSGNTGSSTGPHLHFELHKDKMQYRSQVTNKDYAVDPVVVYPQLKNMFGKYLTGTNFDNKKDTIINKKGGDIVEFKERWQEDLLIENINKFKDKGILNNAEDWLYKIKNKTLTTSELGLLALTMAERSS